LKANGLEAKAGRKRKHRNIKTKAEFESRNLVIAKFEIKKANKLWCADITEMEIYRRKIYISGIIDVGSRRLVGWSIATHQRQEIVQNAIEMAYYRCKPKAGIVFHSDRGCQYTANKTKAMLDKYKMQSSMSRPGKPCDNQPIETLWKTLKQELVDISKMKFGEAKLEVVKYIEMYYNSERLHSSLGYRTPNEVWKERLE